MRQNASSLNKSRISKTEKPSMSLRPSIYFCSTSTVPLIPFCSSWLYWHTVDILEGRMNYPYRLIPYFHHTLSLRLHNRTRCKGTKYLPGMDCPLCNALGVVDRFKAQEYLLSIRVCPTCGSSIYWEKDV